MGIKVNITEGTLPELKFWVELLDTPGMKSEKLRALIDAIKEKIRILSNANI